MLFNVAVLILLIPLVREDLRPKGMMVEISFIGNVKLQLYIILLVDVKS